MATMRVYEIARQLGIDCKELLIKLGRMGYDVKYHNSTIEEEEANKIVSELDQEKKTQFVEKRIGRGIIRRRRVPTSAPPKEPTPPQAPPSPPLEKMQVQSLSLERLDKISGKLEEVTEPRLVEEEVKKEPEMVPELKKVEEEIKVPSEEKVKEEEVEDKPVIATRKVPELTRIKIVEPRVVKKPKKVETKPAAEKTEKNKKEEVVQQDKKDAKAVAPVLGKSPKIDEKILKRIDADEAAKKARRKSFKKRQIARDDTEDLVGRVYIPPQKGKRKKVLKKTAKRTEITVPKAIKRIIKVEEFISMGDLAHRMGVKGTELMKEFMKAGKMYTINQQLDYDTAKEIAQKYNYQVESVVFNVSDYLEEKVEDREEHLEERSPIVTIMGHVDHGKTTLLDAIRNTRVAEREDGGITQSIGAYAVENKGRKITFIDTPGHEAFTAMRARGSKVTDIVVLVVAADDGIKPQTIEAINHAKAAGVPIVIAINKMDKAGANPNKVMQDLTEYELIPEDWGGDIICCQVSAKEKQGLENLLEMILLQAEILEIKANPNKRAKAIIIESKLDKFRGPLTSLVVQEGTLHLGDPLVSGCISGKVRAMINDFGKKITKAGPSEPVEVLGFNGVPGAGDSVYVVKDEKIAKTICTHYQDKQKAAVSHDNNSAMTLDSLYAQLDAKQEKKFRVIIKADVQGSLEAIGVALEKIKVGDISVEIVHKGVGGINERDVILASASECVVIGFNVKSEINAQSVAEKENVTLKIFSIIYDLIDEVTFNLQSMLEPVFKEKVIGKAEIRDVFDIAKLGKAAGVSVLEGKLIRGCYIKLMRKSQVLFEGRMASLKRFKDDVKEVTTGYECGVTLDYYSDYQEGDHLVAIEKVKVAIEQPGQ